MELKLLETFLKIYGKDCLLGFLAVLFAYLWFKVQKEYKEERLLVQAERTARVELASKLGEKIDDPLAMYLSDIFTAPANLSGIPAVSLPLGKSKENLPIGVQFMAPHFSELSLFQISKQLESLHS